MSSSQEKQEKSKSSKSLQAWAWLNDNKWASEDLLRAIPLEYRSSAKELSNSALARALMGLYSLNKPSCCIKIL